MIDLATLLDDRLAIVGTSGSGKTYAAKGMVETLATDGSRLCIVDPLGVWWGLRAGRTGDPDGGLPVLILGGLHADVPIDETQGAAIGAAIARGAVQCVIDVSELGSGAARRRFMTAFLETLHDNNRQPLHLVLDEADLWAPQRPRPDSMALLGRVDEIVRRGRVRGFIPWLITQRPAVLSKDVLSQADVLIAMKLTSAQDRAAIGAWIEGQADRAQEKALLAALPKLPRGDGWVWAPSHDVLEAMHFPPIATFDSSRTPGRADPTAPGRLTPVDAAAFAAMLAPAETAMFLNPAQSEYDTGYADGRQQGRVEGFAAGQSDAYAKIRVAQQAATHALQTLTNWIDDDLDAPNKAAITAAAEPEPPPVSVPGWPDTLTSGPRRVLQVLATRHPASLSEAQWATLARMSRRGGTWSTYRRVMERGGFVARDGKRWRATEQGLAVIGVEAPEPLTPSELLASWKAALGTGPAKLLDALLAHPEGLDRTQLAALVRMAPGGGSFSSYLRALVNHELAHVTRRGRITAADILRDNQGATR